MATHPHQAALLLSPDQNKALNKHEATESYSQRPSETQIRCCVGIMAPGVFTIGWATFSFLFLRAASPLGILGLCIGAEKQDLWSKVTQPLVVEQDLH